MARNLDEVLADSVRGLVGAQSCLDLRAADIARWDREGLPPVALAYTRSRFVLTAPVRVHAQAGANGAVLAPVPDRPGGPPAGAAWATSAVISITVRLHGPPHLEDAGGDDEPAPPTG